MEIPRMFFVMAHVACLLVAAMGIALTDLALFGLPRIDLTLVRRATRAVAWALAAMWLTGLALIWVDTGFDHARLASSPKLIAKVSVALLLTINGLLLHKRFFHALGRLPIDPRRATNEVSVLAAVSGASWLYAGFLGLAGPLAPVLGLAGFVALYLATLAIAGLLVLQLVRPRIRRVCAQAQGCLT